MELSPEQRQQVYEEEKARMEARHEERVTRWDGWVFAGMLALALIIAAFFAHGCPLGMRLVVEPR